MAATDLHSDLRAFSVEAVSFPSFLHAKKVEGRTDEMRDGPPPTASALRGTSGRDLLKDLLGNILMAFDNLNNDLFNCTENVF